MGNVKDNYYVMLHRQDAADLRPDVMVRRHLGAAGVDVEEVVPDSIARELCTLAREGRDFLFARLLRDQAPSVCGGLGDGALAVFRRLFSELRLP